MEIGQNNYGEMYADDVFQELQALTLMRRALRAKADELLQREPVKEEGQVPEL
jgi:hypothetical protein